MEFIFLGYAFLFALAKLGIFLLFILGIYITCRGFLKQSETDIPLDADKALKKVKILFKIVVGLALLIFAISSYNKGFYVVHGVDSKQIHNSTVRSEQYGSDMEIITPEPRTEKLNGFEPLSSGD